MVSHMVNVAHVYTKIDIYIFEDFDVYMHIVRHVSENFKPLRNALELPLYRVPDRVLMFVPMVGFLPIIKIYIWILLDRTVLLAVIYRPIDRLYDVRVKVIDRGL